MRINRPDKIGSKEPKNIWRVCMHERKKATKTDYKKGRKPRKIAFRLTRGKRNG